MEAAILHGWFSILQALAIFSIVAAAFSFMTSMAKPRDAVKHIAAILGTLIALLILPGIAIAAWSGLLLWQKLVLSVFAIAVWLLLRSGTKSRSQGPK